jgi:mRNA-degrading endonuclease toxin of MazEF toxin-antitoxin module
LKLALYSSIAKGAEPNLVSIQDPLLTALPTVLVCPLTTKKMETSVRVPLIWGGKNYVAVCDLVRPWRRDGLRFIGELDASASRRILETFSSLVHPLD